MCDRRIESGDMKRMGVSEWGKSSVLTATCTSPTYTACSWSWQGNSSLCSSSRSTSSCPPRTLPEDHSIPFLLSVPPSLFIIVEIIHLRRFKVWKSSKFWLKIRNFTCLTVCKREFRYFSSRWRWLSSIYFLFNILFIYSFTYLFTDQIQDVGLFPVSLSLSLFATRTE